MLVIIIAQALFFFLPAYIANMCPVIFGNLGWLQFLKKPIDGGRKIGHSKIFGEHKTYLGFVVASLGGLLVGFLQALLFINVAESHWLFLFPYSWSSGLLLGFLLGFGALFGDLIKSFIKRRLHIKEGSPFLPFDQLDFVVGGLLFCSLVYLPSWKHILVLALLTPLLHLLSNVIGYKLGLKKVWW